MKSLGKSFLICLMITIVMLIVAEVGFRVAGFKASGAPPYSINFSSPDKLMGFRCYSNSRWFFDTTPSGNRVERIFGSTDNKGYRPVINNADCTSCRTIVILGDSGVFGVESGNDATWTESFSRELSSGGYPYKVRNISFRGWSTLQESLALEEYIREGGKADYVVYFVVPNDPIENISLVYSMPAPIIERDATGLRLVDPRFDDAFLKMSKRWKIENIVRRSALASYIYKLGGASLLGEADPAPIVKMDTTAYRSFWPNGTTNIESFLELMYANDDRSQLAQMAFSYGVKRMKAVTEAMGAKLIVIPAPFGPVNHGPHADSFKALLGLTDPQFDTFVEKWLRYNHAIERLSSDIGVLYLDVFSAFDDMDYHQYVAAPSDWHYSAEANAVLGRCLAKIMLNRKLIPTQSAPALK